MKDNPEYSIYNFVKDVLKSRFPSNNHRQKINEESDKLNFCCPYCGDSQNDASKKRGNLYFKTNSFKCFNDGCLKWTPLKKFISEFASKYSLRIPKLSEDTNKSRKPNIRKGFLIEFLMNPEVKKSLISFNDVYKRFFLKPCKEAPLDSKIYNYVKSRNLESLPSFEQSCYYDNREDKIYIFNLDIRSGLVLGVSIRHIDPDYPGPRYDIKNYSQFVKNGLIGSIDEDVLTKIDIVNNFFNILNINFNEPIIVLEGQFDSMFIKNSIATTGVTKSKSILGSIVSKTNARILFDNDKAGSVESRKLLSKGYHVFMWSKLMMDIRLDYPNDIREVNDIKDINDLYNFLISKDSNFTYDEFNNMISNYFSNSIYDLIWT